MKKEDLDNRLIELNKEYIKVYYSKEYRIGRKFLIINCYLKRFRFLSLIKKIYHSKMKNNNSIIDNMNNSKIFKNNDKGFDNNYKNEKIAVYTVNIGGYDNVLSPIYENDEIDYYYVSDVKPANLGVWKYIDAKEYIKDKNISNVKKARYLKLHPDLLFKKYKYSIFVDGNIRIVGNISYLINNINKNTKIAIHVHPFRDCIYKEAICCKRSGKGSSKEIDSQIKKYKNEGMPNNYGLFETNVVIREHNNKECKKIMNMWWNEIKNNSERDQLSLTYCLWKLGYTSNDIGILGWNTKENPYLQVLDHKDEYK